MSRNTAATPSSNQHTFANIPGINAQRSVFDRSCNIKTTIDAGILYPIMVDELLPGDTIHIKPTLFARMNTLIVPVMDNLYLETHAFAVPLRLLWTNFKKFMGEQANPADSTSYVTPKLVSPTNGFQRGGALDYMGVPPLATTGTTHSVVAFYTRAMNLIYNEWFRDENLQNSAVVDLDDGPDAESDYPLRRRGKRHDYFTSGLPWPQKGAAVSLPLGTSAPVMGIGLQSNLGARDANVAARQSSGTSPVIPWSVNFDPAVDIGNLQALTLAVKTNSTTAYPDLWADLTNATAATINQLRTAMMVQMMYEREARGGTRYTEWVRAIFGVTSPDARQQRPEFLGGGRINISVNPVPATGGDPINQSPVGTLGAFATAVGNVPSITHTSTEHEVLIIFASVRADLNYMQGTPRMFTRSTKLDYYNPLLAHLGEQAVLSREIYTDGSATDLDVFAYQEAWADYRYKPSLITGKLRTSDPLSLDIWHLAQNFSTRPLLNATFIEDNPPISRVVAVANQPAFFLDGHFSYRHVRAMPTYSVPGLKPYF